MTSSLLKYSPTLSFYRLPSLPGLFVWCHVLLHPLLSSPNSAWRPRYVLSFAYSRCRFWCGGSGVDHRRNRILHPPSPSPTHPPSPLSTPLFLFSSLFLTHSLTQSLHNTLQGAPESLEFRIFQNTKGTVVSAWHDIPLYAGEGHLHFVCEIPKESAAKMELATDEVNNPIKQDTKKGKLRFYPYNINWNYGMLPQTWEDPDHNTPELNAGVSSFILSRVE